jgi:transcriptional regulator with XRE-family HTH domain
MNTEENKKIMARNIKRYMEKKGVTNQQICDALDFKYTTFMDWIKGVTYPRIGKVEAMANYFGCEKSDLIEDKNEQPTVQYDGLSEKRKALIDFAMSVPEDKAEMILQVMKTILKND